MQLAFLRIPFCDISSFPHQPVAIPTQPQIQTHPSEEHEGTRREKAVEWRQWRRRVLVMVVVVVVVVVMGKEEGGEWVASSLPSNGH